MKNHLQFPLAGRTKLVLAHAVLLSLPAALVTGCIGTPQSPVGQIDEAQSVPTPDPKAITWALATRPTTLDSAELANDAAGAQVAAQVYDRLVHLRPGAAELAPGIVADWASDPEGRIFTFTLREDLRFHDGTPLDAQAVVWNFERWMDPEHPSHNGKFVAYRDYFGGFIGQKDDQGRAINLIAEVTAMDSRTVRVTLNAPFAPFLHHLAMVPFGFASPAAAKAQGEDYGTDGEHLPVGSGPFKVVGWFDDGTVILRAHEGYWGGPPAAPGLRFVVIPKPAERALAVAEGAVHGADLPPTTAVTGSLTAPEVLISSRPSRSSAWLMLNHTRDPLGDEVVRRALSMAIDRDKLAREEFGAAAQPANQMLPPGFLGYEPELEPLAYDPAAAKRLLEENGYSEGFKLNIWVANTARGYLPDPMSTAAALAEMLQEIGIDANVRSVNLRQFLMDRDRGRFTAWIIGWEAQSADPDNFWFWHFGAGRNASEGQYVNPDLRTALLDAQRTINSADREEIYRAAARTVNVDTPRLFLAHASPLVAVSRWIEGYEPGPMGFDDFHEVSLREGSRPAAGETPYGIATSPAADATSAPDPSAPTAVQAEPIEDEAGDGDEEAVGDEETDEPVDTEEGLDEPAPTPAATPTKRSRTED